MAYQYVNKQEALLAKVKGKTGKISDKTHEEHLKLYTGYVTRASDLGPAERDNTPVMQRLLELRQEVAQLLGNTEMLPQPILATVDHFRA